MRRTIAIFIGVSIALSVGYAKLLPEALGAPDLTYQKSLMPITGSVYELGTTSRPWLRGTFDELCLTSSTCISSWLAGGGGGGGFPLYIQNGGATQNVGTTTLNFTPNSFSLTESPDDTFSIRVSTTTLGLLASSISDFVSTVRTSISETILGIGYDSGTGIFSLDSGYTIPTTTRANNWDTAFGWGNHASQGYITDGNTNWDNSYGFITGNGTTTLTGDVSGSGTTTISVTVTDDSHNHTGTTISGLDVSSDTNLTVSATGLELSADAIALSAGYVIPTTTRALNWDTAFAWGNHASAGYDQVTTAGDGLTRTLNDFDCDTGSGSVFGCITAADWVTFNSKVSSTSIDTSNELLALLDDETGTAGSLVFSTNPLLQGFRSNASSTIGDGTGIGGLTILGNATTTGNAYFAGNVGIGTSTPSSRLNVYGNTENLVRITNSAATAGGDWNIAIGSGANFSHGYLNITQGKPSSSNYELQFQGSGVVQARMAFSAPSFNSTITGRGASSILAWTNDGGNFNGTLDVGQEYINGNTNLNNWINGTGTLAVKRGSDSATLMTILSANGNVGIGSSSPSRRLAVSGDIYSTGNLTAASSTLGNATSTSLAITGISGSTQCLRVNSSGVVSGTGSDCASGADGMSNWSLVNGALTPTTTTATYGIRVNASSTIGGGTAVTGLTISGGATTTGNHLIMGSATSTTSFFSALGTFTNSVINTLLTAVNATITGVLTIPNGTGPTSDDPGEISHDTSDNQLILDDYVIRTKEELYQFSVGSTSPAFVSGVTKYLPVKEDGYVVTDIYCTTEGGTNKAITVFGEAITCDGDGAADDGSISIATVGAASTTVPVTMGATSGTVNYVNVTITGKYVRE